MNVLLTTPRTVSRVRLSEFHSIATAALVCLLALMLCGQVTAADWNDGFNGSVGNWSLRAGTAMTYSTAQNHNTYTGAGCMAHPTASSEMYRSTGSRPYHAGIATACHYDSVRWRAGYCGNTYRQLLGVAGPTYSTYQLAVGHYSAGATGDFFRRDSGGSYTSIGAKGARTTCAGGWIFFVVECQADGDVYRRADDGVVNLTHTRARTSTEINAGIAMVTLGLGASSTNTGYWDDVTWDGYDPGTPTGIAATANSTTQITWTANAAADTNQFGFALMNGTTEEVVSPTTARQSSANLVETGLSANTSYTRGIRAWNGSNNSATSSTLARYTLIETPAAPTFGTITTDSIVVNTSGCSHITSGTSGAYFDETTGGGDGGLNAWVQALTDTSTGLSANTQYTFHVKARNGQSVETAYSGTASKYTLQNDAAAPTFGAVGADSIELSTTGPVNLTAGSSGVIFKRDGTTDLAKVQALSATDSNLTPNVQYSYTARGVNGDNTATSESSSASKYTLAKAGEDTDGSGGSGNVWCTNASKSTWYPAGKKFAFSNPAGFGASTHGGSAWKASSFEYKWTQNSTEDWSSIGTAWASGTIEMTPAADGDWYLHVRAFNGDAVANNTNTLSYRPFKYDGTAPTGAADAEWVSGSASYADGSVTLKWTNGSYGDTGGSALKTSPLAIFDGTGQVSADLAADATSVTFAESTPGDRTYTLGLSDNAGNRADKTGFAVKVPAAAENPWIYTGTNPSLSPPGIYPTNPTKVLTGFNSHKVHGISSSGSPDGAMMWAPLSTGGAIQGRVPIGLFGSTFKAFAGSQDYYVYCINAQTGAQLWAHNMGTGYGVNKSVAAQFAVGGKDLIFAGSYSLSGSDNFLRAIDASDGSTVWTFGSGYSVGAICGGPAVVPPANTVYFTSMRASGGSSLWAVNTTDGTLRWSADIGHSDYSVSTNNTGSVIYAADNNGKLYAYDSAGNKKWEFTMDSGYDVLGAPAFAAGKLYVATANDKLWCIVDNGSSAAVNAAWGGGNGYVSIQTPSQPVPVVNYYNAVYVGSSDGKLYELNMTDGSVNDYRDLGSTVGDPTVDPAKIRIYAGTSAGRIHAFTIPF